MVKAVLCDIDGTLVESNWLHAAAWKDAFAVANIEVELEEVRRQIGKGGDEMIPVFVPWWKRAAIEEPLKAYRKQLFLRKYLPEVKPFPKVRELMLRMQEAGIRISLASSADKEQLNAYPEAGRDRRSGRGEYIGRRCGAVEAAPGHLRIDAEEAEIAGARCSGAWGYALRCGGSRQGRHPDGGGDDRGMERKGAAICRLRGGL